MLGSDCIIVELATGAGFMLACLLTGEGTAGCLKPGADGGALGAAGAWELS